jgi:hypothetical protein
MLDDMNHTDQEGDRGKAKGEIECLEESWRKEKEDREGNSQVLFVSNQDLILIHLSPFPG